jgi:hypothetical protein
MKYYRKDNGTVLLLTDDQNVSYHFLNRSGEWQNGAGIFEKYFFNGEMGYEQIDRGTAEEMAEQFGSTLAVGEAGLLAPDPAPPYDPEDDYDEEDPAAEAD